MKTTTSRAHGTHCASKNDRRARSRRRSLFGYERLEERALLTTLFTPQSGPVTVQDFGGPRLGTQAPGVAVDLIFWGSYWQTTDGQAQATSDLSLVNPVLANSALLDGLHQYGSSYRVDPSATGHVFDTSSEPGTDFTDSQLQGEVDHAIATLGLIDSKNAIYYVVTPPSSQSVEHNKAAYHGAEVLQDGTYRYYGWLENFGGDQTPPNDLFTEALSRETLESFTDPAFNLQSGIIVTSGTAGEICDGEAQQHTALLNNNLVESFWSRSDNAYAIYDGNTQKVTVDVNGNLIVKRDQAGHSNDIITLGLNSRGGVSLILNGEDFEFSPNTIQHITINTGGGTNQTFIRQTTDTAPVTINAGGQDTVTIGFQGLTSAIRGDVQIGGSGGTRLIIDNSADTTSLDSVNFDKNLFNELVTGIAPATIGWSPGSGTTGGVISLDISVGTGDDSITVTQFPSIPTNLRGNGGTDTIALATDDISDTWMINSTNGGQVGGIAFNGFESLIGGPGDDTFTISNGVTFDGSIDGGDGLTNKIDESGWSSAVSADLSASTITGVSGSFNNIQKFSAGNNSAISNTLKGFPTANAFTINSSNSGILNGGVLFVGFGNLVGGAANDTFSFANGGTLAGSINGGAGNNTIDVTAVSSAISVDLGNSVLTGISGFSRVQTINASPTSGNKLVGTAAGTTFSITGADAVTVGGVAFNGFGNIQAGAGNDNFIFNDGATLSGTLNAGLGNNTLDESAYRTAVSANLATGSITGVASYSGLTTLIGSSVAGGTLTGPSGDSNWKVTDINAGNVGGVTFRNYSTLIGGAGNDTFQFSAGAMLDGSVDGGGGLLNSINDSAYTTPVSLKMATNSLTGLGGTYSHIQSITPGSGANTLTGPTAGSTYNITGVNSGSVAGVNFSKFGSLVGGPGTDTFNFTGAGLLSGGIKGGGGADTINLSTLTKIESIDLDKSTISLTTSVGTSLFSFSQIKTFVGNGNANNQIQGPALSTTFNITGVGSGTVAGISYNGFPNLSGGAAKNTFRIADGVAFTGKIIGGTSNQDVIDESSWTKAVTVNVTAANAGNIGGLTFTGVGSFMTGTGDDSFVLSDKATLSGSIDGGAGSNTIDDRAYTSAVVADASKGTITGVPSYSNITNLYGGKTVAGTFIGPAAASVYNVTGLNAGLVTGVNFYNFGSLNAGPGNDMFLFSDNAKINGLIDGGGGFNNVDATAYTTPMSLDLRSAKLTEGGQTFSFANIQKFSGGQKLSVGNGNNTLTGPAASSTYSITGVNSGSVGGVGFVGFGTILAGSNDDNFVFSDIASLSGSLAGGGGNDTINESLVTAPITLNIGASTLTGIGGTYSGVKNVTAGSNSQNRLVGPSTDTAFAITGVKSGQVPGVSFSGFGNLVGGAGKNTFKFSDGIVFDGNITGGSGGPNSMDYSSWSTPLTLTLTGPNAGNLVANVGANSGTISFTGIANLYAGAGNDRFVFSDGASLSGKIDGHGGSNAIDAASVTSPITLNLGTSTITGLVGSFAGIQNVTGGGSGNLNNLLIGPATNTTFYINGPASGFTSGGIGFNNFTTLTGGSGNNTFKISNGITFTGTINGGTGGSNTIDDSLWYTPVSTDLGASTMTGLLKPFSNIQSVKGTVHAPSTLKVGVAASSATFNITAPDAGTVAGVAFTNFGNLGGGTGNDTFQLGNAGTLSGSVDGGGGSDTIDERSVLAPITLDLSMMSISGIKGSFANIGNIYSRLTTNTVNALLGPAADSTYAITGAYTVTVGGIYTYGFKSLTGGPGNDNFKISGVAYYGTINGGAGSDTLDDSLIAAPVGFDFTRGLVTGISAPYAFSNIENFKGGTNSRNTVTGPAASTTYNIISRDRFDANGFHFSGFQNIIAGAGEDTFVVGSGAALSGSINGGAGNNWLDYSACSSDVTVNLATGSATGFDRGIFNIRNVRGGSGNDQLTGNALGNILLGGDGNDTLIGGSGSSLLIGGTGSDTVVGGAADDIVIGGYTTLDNDNLALDSILAEWQSVDDSYSTRISLIKNGGGLNESNVFNFGSTVIDDLAANVLTGGTGNNWFFKGSRDNITDLVAGEQVN